MKFIANKWQRRFPTEEHIRPKLAGFVNTSHKPIKVHLAVPGEVGPSKKEPKKKNGTLSSFSLVFEDLDPSLSFDSFMQATDHTLAYSAIQEMVSDLTKVRLNTISFGGKAEPRQAQSNPLYLYGPEGSGKTHLLMSVAHKLRSVGYNVVYARAETFTEHLVKAIRAAEMASLRVLYRNADVLIIDDVHTFSRKSATQEEFFHTFNSLHLAGKQIFLSASAAPQFLQFIEPRLISRFEWGIVLELHSLQSKEVIALIEKRATQLRLPLAPRVCQFLAESFSYNPKTVIRALHTLVLRTHLVSKTKRQETVFTLAHIQSLLADSLEQEKRSALTAPKIMQAVAAHHGITAEDIVGKSQARECVIPRQIAMYLCRKHLKMPFIHIGDAFCRDHSTVMSAIRQVERNCQEGNAAAVVKAIELGLR